MELRILGPLEAFANGQQVLIGRGKPQALLALLALRRGTVVSTDAIIDCLWGERPPQTAVKSVQVYVSRLRRSLGDDVIVTRPPGYALEIEPEQLDLARFERLVDEARQLPPAEAATSLRDALALWRGPPLADLHEGFADAEIARLEELRLSALEERIDTDLALGRSAQVIPELEGLVRTHPYRERLRGQLMLALYRSGRQAEALDVYRETRTTLSEELGLEPGDDLRELERRILAQDSALADSPATPSAEPRRPKGRRRLAAVAIVFAVVALGMTVGIVALSNGDSASAVVAAQNSVAVIDPAQNAVVDTVPLGERPTQIAAYGDDVWVLHPDRGTVSHVSASEPELLGTVGVGRTASGLVAEERGVWVSDARSGRLTLIEPERLMVAATVRARAHPVAGPFSDAGHLAIGFGSLWFASGNRTISRIDPLTGRVTARIRPVETGQSNGGIATGEGSVWVAGPFGGSPLTRIDPTRNRVFAKIAVPKFRSSGVTVAGGSVWVTDAGNDHVWRIDPGRNVAVATAEVGLAPLGVAFGHGSIWVANAGDGTVSRIDPVTARVAGTIQVGGSPTGLAVTNDAVWVTVA